LTGVTKTRGASDRVGGDWPGGDWPLPYDGSLPEPGDL